MDYDLVIVGLGPVGAVAANLAGQWGLRTLVLEKTDTIYQKPRAIGFDHEAMRALDNIGLADALAPHIMPYRPSHYRNASGQLMKLIDVAPPPYALGWAPNYVFSQPPLENGLRERLAARPEVDVRLGHEVLEVTQDTEGARVTFRDGDGSVSVVSTSYVFACDGGTSGIRKSLGLAMEDLDFEEPWLVVDVLLKEGASDELPATNVQFCEPERPTTFVVGPGNHRRWEFMVNPGESLDDLVQPETIRSLVGRWLEPDEYDVWRAATYRFYALISEQWRVGNIFFLGDSAHMTPPFLAQGMCQGIRDAMNLVWKLALVHRGVAATALLDSYHLERAPHVRRTTEIAKGFGELVCERDLDRAAARDQILLAELAAAPQGTLRDSLIPPLVTGYLDDDAPAGALFPQPRVTDSTGREDLLDRFTGQNFRLVLGVGYGNAPELDALVSTYGTHIPLSVVRLTDDAPAAQDEYRERDGILSRWLEKYGARAVLVRPDHYVFGSATDHAETIGLLERGLGGLVRRDGVPA